MGHKLDTTIFNTDLWQKYLCPKCRLVLKDAVQPSCGHWLCQSCADAILAPDNEKWVQELSVNLSNSSGVQYMYLFRSVASRYAPGTIAGRNLLPKMALRYWQQVVFLLLPWCLPW